MPIQQFSTSPGLANLFATFRRVNGSTLEIRNVTTAAWVAETTNPAAADCDVAVTERGTNTGIYEVTDPTGLDSSANRFFVRIQDHGGGTPSLNVSTNPEVASGWVGPESVTVTAIATDAITAASVSAAAGEEIADALLGRINGIETGVTPKQALQRIGAIAGGRISGAGTGTEVFLGLDGLTTRVTVTVDSSGNRSTVVYA